MIAPFTTLPRGGLIVLGQRLRRVVFSSPGSTSTMLHRSKTRSRLMVKSTNSAYKTSSGTSTQLEFLHHKDSLGDPSSSYRPNDSSEL